MKFICSLLILVGVFALNDASIPYEAQMRIVKDKMRLADLKKMALNRDMSSSIQCSQDLLAILTEILGTYNSDLDNCNKTKTEEIEAHNAAARKRVEQFSADTQNTCDSLNACNELDSIEAILLCYESESSQSARTLTAVSNEATTAKVELQKNIENSNGKEDICKTKAYTDYSTKSDKANDDFNNCVNNKNGNKPTTTTTTTTKAPAPTPPAENGEPASRGGRQNRHHKNMGV
ncbi:uncharacterized protein LOC129951241 [Eupeodes corollae]|uniref:uncharacterized protein LOC129951241 n=1 Tax=Eupeodes corollae TaxID=290404 RepID=UPI0024901325|nr:uncharacterized protein LOC129951241 [Eupeodes corollae]